MDRNVLFLCSPQLSFEPALPFFDWMMHCAAKATRKWSITIRYLDKNLLMKYCQHLILRIPLLGRTFSIFNSWPSIQFKFCCYFTDCCDSLFGVTGKVAGSGKSLLLINWNQWKSVPLNPQNSCWLWSKLKRLNSNFSPDCDRVTLSPGPCH